MDYNQNAWGRTLASVYSVRPTEEATVSTPVTWQEVERGVEIEDFRIDNVPARVRRRGDLWKPLLARARTLPAGGRAVSLPLRFPYPPMEAEIGRELPDGGGWQYEPKWDGFRCLAFRDGDTVRIQSKAGKPLGRYFPDVVESLAALGAKRFVLDGEIVIPVDGRLSFDELLLRVHPAASRVRTLVEAHRARLVVFDLLVDERGRSLVDAAARGAAGAARALRQAVLLVATRQHRALARDHARLATARPGSPAAATATSTASWPSGSTCRTARASATGWSR